MWVFDICLKLTDVVQTSTVGGVDCYSVECDQRNKVRGVSKCERCNHDSAVRMRKFSRVVILSDISQFEAWRD